MNKKQQPWTSNNTKPSYQPSEAALSGTNILSNQTNAQLLSLFCKQIQDCGYLTYCNCISKTLSKMAAGTVLTYASKRPAKSEHLPLCLTSITISCDTQRTMGSIAKPNSLTYQTELCKSNSKSYVIIQAMITSVRIVSASFMQLKSIKITTATLSQCAICYSTHQQLSPNATSEFNRLRQNKPLANIFAYFKLNASNASHSIVVHFLYQFYGGSSSKGISASSICCTCSGV